MMDDAALVGLTRPLRGLGSTPFPSDATLHGFNRSLADLLEEHAGDRLEHLFLRSRRFIAGLASANRPRPQPNPSQAYIAGTFTADIQAVARDDGAVWLHHLDGLSLKATYTTGRAERHHVEGRFPAAVWTGVVSFQRTTTGLWLLTLPSGNTFTVIIWPEELSDRGPEKVCHGCHVSRPVGVFTPHKKSPDGLQHRCVDCSSTPRQAVKRQSKARVSPAFRRVAAAMVPSVGGFKTCPSCLVSKPARKPFFVGDPQTADGLQHACAVCSDTVAALMWARGARSLG